MVNAEGEGVSAAQWVALWFWLDIYPFDTHPCLLWRYRYVRRFWHSIVPQIHHPSPYLLIKVYFSLYAKADFAAISREDFSAFLPRILVRLAYVSAPLNRHYHP